jgi:hypothetical protein
MNVLTQRLKGYFMRVLRTMVLVATLAIPALAAPAGAQTAVITPTDYGRGIKLGIQQLNNSGQVGWVTLFSRDGKTLVAITLDGTSRREPAHIHRAKSCDAPSEIDPAVVAPLADVVGGKSSTTVNLPTARLLSGNYAVVVHSPNGGSYFACGHLGQRLGL